MGRLAKESLLVSFIYFYLFGGAVSFFFGLVVYAFCLATFFELVVLALFWLLQKGVFAFPFGYYFWGWLGRPKGKVPGPSPN